MEFLITAEEFELLSQKDQKLVVISLPLLWKKKNPNFNQKNKIHFHAKDCSLIP